jgi:hypothetical protein
VASADCLDGDVLHTATISGVLACLMRHFRASLASLPLLAQPLSALPIGTWAPTSSLAAGIELEEQQRALQVGGWVVAGRASVWGPSWDGHVRASHTTAAANRTWIGPPLITDVSNR